MAVAALRGYSGGVWSRSAIVKVPDVEMSPPLSLPLPLLVFDKVEVALSAAPADYVIIASPPKVQRRKQAIRTCRLRP